MGQRLVISVINDGGDFCKIYYHWSAYTLSALEETRKIINCIYNHKDETEKELKLRLIHFCEKNGGGIDGANGEIDYVKNLYPNETFLTDGYSRNDGLIAISERGMDDMQRYSEGDVFIDIENDTVDFCVYSGYDDIDEYNQERSSWDDDYTPLKLEQIPDMGEPLGFFGVTEIDDVIEAFERAAKESPEYTYVIRSGSEIIEIIG